jgi:hypothetical protein
MGTWARRVIEIKMADASFKFQDEPDLVNFLNSEIEVYGNLHDGGGIIDVPLNILRKTVRKAEELNLSPETIKHLKEDIKFAKQHNDESVTYSCF